MNTGTVLTREEKKITASGTVGREEEFFQDHFPAFPVVPGVMILEIFKRTAERYFGNRDAAFYLREVRNVKFSNYLRPGDSWEARLEMILEQNGESEWKARLLSSDRSVCTAQFKLQKI